MGFPAKSKILWGKIPSSLNSLPLPLLKGKGIQGMELLNLKKRASRNLGRLSGLASDQRLSRWSSGSDYQDNDHYG